MRMTNRYHRSDDSAEQGTIWHWYVAIQRGEDTAHAHVAYGEAAGVEAAQTCAEIIFAGVPDSESAEVVMWTWKGHAIHATLKHAPEGVE